MQEKQPKHTTLTKKLFSGSGWALLTMFVWELVEEGLENLIALALSSGIALFVTKALSTLAIITATQGIKVSLKRFLLPLIKNLTYKGGNDKVKKVLNILKTIFANKGTIYGIIGSALMVISGTGLIDVNSFPAIYINAINITPFIYYGLLAIFFVMATWFPETFEKFKERVDTTKAEKEMVAIKKIAKKEMVAEQKKANQTQAEQDKAKAKEEADAKAKAEKEKANAEYRAKVEKVKADLLNEKTITIIQEENK